MSFVAGLLLAVGTALARLYGPWPLALAARFYVWVIRGTPLLVQLFVIFYGLPYIGVVLDPLVAALIGFTLSVGAYNLEVIRAAIESIPSGQWEAAYRSTSTARALRRIALPQAARVAVPLLRQRLHRTGQGHFAGGGDHRARAAPAGAAHRRRDL